MTWKDILTRLYKEGRITAERVNAAVEKGIISQEDAQEILTQ